MLSTGWSRLTHTFNSGHANNSLPFLAILQNAAGQAWTRCASMKTGRHDILPGPSTSPDDTLRSSPLAHSEPSDHRFSHRRMHTVVGREYQATSQATHVVSSPRSGQNVRYVDPNSLTDHDTKYVHPGRLPFSELTESFSEDDIIWTPCYWGDPSLTFLPGSRQISSSSAPSFLPVAASRNTLYQNLIHMSYRKPPPSLPQLIDYHEFHPETRSTRSYNFLISIALRCAAFGSVQWLLESMAAANIAQNLETQKLVIRWLIYTGNWERAWQFLTDEGGQIQFVSGPGTNNDNRPPWPDFIWLEFFRSLRRGAMRASKQQEPVIEAERADPLLLYAQRYLLLMENRPSSLSLHSSPRVLYFIVHALLRLKRQDHALKLTEAYLNSLSLSLSPRHASYCMDVLHLLLVFGSEDKGLRKFQAQRRTLMSLLALHPSLKPNPTTLFLLLGSLFGARRSGTLALDVLTSFRRRWGEAVLDNRVRRRVASLALKEGRLDIANKLIGLERLERQKQALDSRRTKMVSFTGQPVRRPRHLDMYPKKGREVSLWHRLQIRRRKSLREKRKLVAVLHAIQS